MEYTQEEIIRAIETFEDYLTADDHMSGIDCNCKYCQAAKIALVALKRIIPVEPPMDLWFMCPTCGYDDDDFWDLLGFEPDPQPGSPDLLKWVGPSYCRNCGQSLDMSELNKESGTNADKE